MTKSQTKVRKKTTQVPTVNRDDGHHTKITAVLRSYGMSFQLKFIWTRHYLCFGNGRKHSDDILYYLDTVMYVTINVAHLLHIFKNLHPTNGTNGNILSHVCKLCELYARNCWELNVPEREVSRAWWWTASDECREVLSRLTPDTSSRNLPPAYTAAITQQQQQQWFLL